MNYIKVNYIGNIRAILKLYINHQLILSTQAFVGKNGVTRKHIEGDGKTSLGIYELGIIFGTHSKDEIQIKDYIQINKYLYWVDDVKSTYYNKMVDITKVKRDWKSAEHLIEYQKQYEYAIEIKTNIKNIPGKGSAVFLHCSTGNPTEGCIAIDRESMIQIIECIKKYGKNNINIEIM